ncbi:copper resistance CopC family protein [Sinomonas sp.]|uniref:copper resistance CopC family protein n=1 Tax=Sinomonas sp. TaxID=1914986 RepID=UPI002FE35E71
MTHRRVRSLARAVAVLGLAAGLALPAAAAQAHDVLEATNPANGSTVAAVPDAVVLTYDHTPIAIGTEIQVKDASGTNQADGAATVVDNNVTQAIKPDAPAGKYTVVWRVVSSDSHPIEGTFTFTARAAGGGTSGAAATDGATSTTAAEPTSSSASGASDGFPVWTIPVGVLVLVVIAGLGWFVRRSLSRAAGE